MGRAVTLDAISACDVSLSDRRNVASSADDMMEKRTGMALTMAPRKIVGYSYGGNNMRNDALSTIVLQLLLLLVASGKEHLMDDMIDGRDGVDRQE